MPSGSAQQPEPNLRVLQVGDAIEQPLGGFHSANGVGSAESIIANGGAQELKVAHDPAGPRRCIQQCRWEVAIKVGRRRRPHRSHFGLVQIQGEAQRGCPVLKVGQSCGYCSDVTCKEPIVEVEHRQVNPLLELLCESLDGKRKEEGTKWISLLHTARRGQCGGPKTKASVAPIAPPSPAREAGEAGLHRLQHGSAADSVEGIVEVELHNRFPGTIAVSVNPRTGSVHRSFGPCRHANPNLSWPKRSAHFVPDLAEEALPDKAAKDLPNGDRPNAAARLGHRDKAGTC
jgi:hypothetical protein